MKINIVELDNKEYYFVKKVNVDGKSYCYFTNVVDNEDICIRKLIIENNDYVLVGLDNETELYEALSYFDNNKRN